MKLAAALFLCAAPAVAQAANTVTLPVGCEAYLTVQDRSCTVDHHFRCEGDPAGEQQRMSFDELGIAFIGRIDDEAQWIESFHARSSHSEQLAPNPVDPASLTELITTMRDSFDFQTVSAEVGVTRYVGEDRLTGQRRVVDGVELHETAFNLKAYNADGTMIWGAEGNEYIHPEWRMFLSGTNVVTTGDDSFERDSTPVEFIFPGEPGFLSTRPKHGCGVMMSAVPSLQENANDKL